MKLIVSVLLMALMFCGCERNNNAAKRQKFLQRYDEVSIKWCEEVKQRYSLESIVDQAIVDGQSDDADAFCRNPENLRPLIEFLKGYENDPRLPEMIRMVRYFDAAFYILDKGKSKEAVPILGRYLDKFDAGELELWRELDGNPLERALFRIGGTEVVPYLSRYQKKQDWASSWFAIISRGKAEDFGHSMEYRYDKFAKLGNKEAYQAIQDSYFRMKIKYGWQPYGKVFLDAIHMEKFEWPQPLEQQE